MSKNKTNDKVSVVLPADFFDSLGVGKCTVNGADERLDIEEILEAMKTFEGQKTKPVNMSVRPGYQSEFNEVMPKSLFRWQIVVMLLRK